MHIKQIHNKLSSIVERALKDIAAKNPPQKPFGAHTIELEVPREYKHGDITTNVAMRYAKVLSIQAMELADILKEAIASALKAEKIDDAIRAVEVLRPGFINFWLSSDCLYGNLSKICREKDRYGSSNLGGDLRVNIEFVSANPTGPLTVAHGRQAAVGDALARILKFSGYTVSREYFINDVGTQIELLGKSLYARYAALTAAMRPFRKTATTVST